MMDWSRMTVCHMPRPQPATDAGRPGKGMSVFLPPVFLPRIPGFLPITY
jgi:hypothetical protein